MHTTNSFNLNNSSAFSPSIMRASCVRMVGILASGFLLGGVSIPANASTLLNSTDYLNYELPNSLQAQCVKRSNCPEIEIKYLDTNHSWINDITNKRINQLVVNSELNESAPIKTKPDQTVVNAAIDDFARSQFQDIPEGSSLSYSMMITPNYIGHVDDFELFEIDTYVFTGGAHGMPYSEYMMFDLSTKKQIKLDDMLLVDKKSKFEALAYDAYRAWVKTVDDDVSSYEQSWPFTLSDNITLTDKGIDIRYQHYSIGPYAYGMPILSIPYSKLDGIIKPRFIVE